MRLLWIATKVPLPPVDGGRLVQKLTLEALAELGVEVSLVAPILPGGGGPGEDRPGEDRAALEAELAAFCEPFLVRVERRGPGASLWTARPGGLPLALARHAHPEVARRVAALARARAASDAPFQVVHCEQLHALPQAAPARRVGLPVVLRTQNVESDLWRAAADLLAGPRWGPRSLAARAEAWRLARWEGRAVGGVDRTVALTRPDARRLEALASVADVSAASNVSVVPSPFPATLPAGPRPLPGAPAVVVLGSAGWAPNRDAARYVVEEVWPAVRRRLPGAELHLFGDGELGDGEGVTRHPAPRDSAAAFAPGSVLAVPLRIASGVRMKILEAWARGVPVVATPEAATGLDAEDGRHLLVAADPAAFAAALASLAGEGGKEIGRRLVAGGRKLLERSHAPSAVAAALREVYLEVSEDVSRRPRR